MRVRTAFVMSLTVVLAMVIAVGPGGDPEGPGLPGPGVAHAALQPFGACDEMLDYVRTHALEQVGAWGLGMGGDFFGGDVAVDFDMAEAGAADGAGQGSITRQAAPAAPATGGDEAFSGTNVQEVGVDEPDIVKTDGRVLYAVTGQILRLVDVSGAQPTELGRLRLDQDWGNELLLDGDRLLVLATAHREVGVGRPMPVDPGIGGDARIGIMPMGSPTAVLTMVDVSDPRSPRVVETVSIDGQYLSARLVDGVARVVVRSEPTALPFVHPQAGGIRAEEEAREHNRQVIREAPAEDWLPFFVHTDAAGTRSDGTLLPCEAVHHPDEFSGLSTVTVLSMPLDGGLTPGPATAVLGAGDTVSASTDRLYVATNRWSDVIALREAGPEATDPPEVSTGIHAFDITGPVARYTASGAVPGTLLNQFALSEHEGHLRAATTEGSPWWGEGRRPQESRVTVLAESDGALVEVGSVTGLGPDERIYAVRFLGDVGYVVTFRETDPLYTIDLSDPRSPRVRGELKIPGYSAYLHPLGDGLVLGVGQDATDQGLRLGAQLSLFDVANLDAPQRIATLALGEASDPERGGGAETEVEHDHRAFLWWPAAGLAVLPVQQWSHDPNSGVEDIRSSAVGVVVADRTLREVGHASHLAQVAPQGTDDPRFHEVAWRANVRRSLVVGDRLYTVSDVGVMSSTLTDLTTTGWTAFGG